MATDFGGPIIGGFALTEACEHVDFIVHGRSAFQQPASSLPIYDSDELLVPATTFSSTAGKPALPGRSSQVLPVPRGNQVVSLGRGELIVTHSGVNALKDH